MTNTFTPYIVDVYIPIPEKFSADISEASLTVDDYILHPDSKKNKIIVSELTYSGAMFDIPSANIKLEYTDQDGLSQIINMFPRSGNPTRNFFIRVELRSSPENKSSITKDKIEVFRGYIDGYSITSTPGSNIITISGKATGCSLDTHKMATAGMVGDPVGTLYQYTAESYYGDSPVNTFVLELEKLKTPTNYAKTPGDLFWDIWNIYFDVLDNSQWGENSDLRKLFENGVASLHETMSLRAPETNMTWWTKTKTHEIDQSLFVSNVIDIIIGHIKAENNFSFWQLMTMLANLYFVNITHTGTGIFLWPSVPLGLPVENVNHIPVGDITRISVSDAPFADHTRVVVMTSAPINSYFTRTPSSNFFGVFPPEDDEDTRDLEMKIGANILFANSPPHIGNYIRTASILGKNNAPKVKLYNSAATAVATVINTAKDSNATTDSDIIAFLQDMTNKFAEYFYYEKKNAQRTCVLTTRFRPDIIPGLPCYVENPHSRDLDIICVPLTVSHGISQSSAGTSIMANHVRYKNEYPDNILNPFYPNATTVVSDAAEMVRSNSL
jgi:hypothetical protein